MLIKFQHETVDQMIPKGYKEDIEQHNKNEVKQVEQPSAVSDEVTQLVQFVLKNFYQVI